MNNNQAKLIYPLLGTLCALAGSLALMGRNVNESALLFWILLFLAANIFTAAGVILRTKSETVRIPRRRIAAEEEKDPPEEQETTVWRIPVLPLFLALAAALIAGLYSGSVFDGFLVFFTWGMLGYPLAHCILRRYPFGFSLQAGLLSSLVVTALAGVLHVFKASPDHSFQLKYCFDAAVQAVANKLLPGVEMMKSILALQPTDGINESNAVLLFRTQSAQAIAEGLAETLSMMVPALFAVSVLACLCLIWWVVKEILKKSSDLPVKYMGRLDGYVPTGAVTATYMIAFVVSLFAGESLWMSILASNLSSIASAVLLFSGYSLILFIINTRATSKPIRIVLSVLTVLLAFDSCGNQLLIFAGIFNSGMLRAVIGGGTLK